MDAEAAPYENPEESTVFADADHPMNRPLLILTAVTAEMRPIRRKLRLARLRRAQSLAGGRASFASRDLPWFGVVTGMGAVDVDGWLGEALERTGAEAALVVGLAGSLVAPAHTGEIIVPAQVLDAVTGRRLAPTLDLGVVPAGRLVSADAPLPTPAAKAEFGRRFDASTVDMESARVAAACQERGVDWACVRAVGDELRDTMPRPFATIVRPDGAADPAAALRVLAARPDLTPALIRTARCAQLACRSLAEFLKATLRDAPAP